MASTTWIFVVATLCLAMQAAISNASRGICTRQHHRVTVEDYTFTTYSSRGQGYRYGCGWWRRCRGTRYHLVSHSNTATRQRVVYSTQQYCCPGYSGAPPNCQPVCNPPCQHGGRCTSPNVCLCTNQWSGRLCQNAVCNPPCQHGGSCTSPGACLCTSEWQGNLCQNAVCNPPCWNGGTCTSPNVCQCTSSWEGPSCQNAVCNPPCQHGGTCARGNVCRCTSGWRGDQCQERESMRFAHLLASMVVHVLLLTHVTVLLDGQDIAVIKRCVPQVAKMEEPVLLLINVRAQQVGLEAIVHKLSVFQSVRTMECVLLLDTADVLRSGRETDVKERHANHHARMVVPVIMAPASARHIGKDQCANQLFVNHRVLMEERVLHQTTAPVLLDGEDLAVNQLLVNLAVRIVEYVSITHVTALLVGQETAVGKLFVYPMDVQMEDTAYALAIALVQQAGREQDAKTVSVMSAATMGLVPDAMSALAMMDGMEPGVIEQSVIHLA